MKVIITGGEGFIGKSLASHLESRGAQVISIDRKSGIEVEDYFSTADLSDIFCVFHLAAQTSVFNDNIEQIRKDNIDSFITVCNACKRYGVKLVYASSSTANPCNTSSMYGISKRFDEEYARCYNPKATGVRFHNVYGPNPRQGTLLWYLLNEKKVTLYNGGKNVRHFTYIDDVVEGLVYAIACNKPLVNIANPEEMSILQFSNIVSKYNGVDIELVNENRDFDHFAQEVDESIFTIPLRYTSVYEGVSSVFIFKLHL